MNKTKLCKCNLCNNIMIDQNPENQKESQLIGNELEMQYLPGLIEYQNSVKEGQIWVCPVCMTDEYLSDYER